MIDDGIPFELPAHIPPEAVRTFPLSRLSPTESDPFDVLIPEIHRGPDVFYAPHSHPYGSNAWVFRKADEIRRAFLDNEHFSVTGSPDIARFFDEDWGLIPINLDPPEHALYRQALNPMFAPKRMEELADSVEIEANRLVDRFVERGSCDLMRDFATPFPVAIFLRLLGMSLDEMDQYVQWEHIAVHNKAPELKRGAVHSIRDSLAAAMADRRRKPENDVLTQLLHVEVDGRRLTELELMRTALNLFFAGLDTVTATSGWIFKHLATYPEHQALLRARPGLMDCAVEELARAFAPVTVHRLCVKPYTASNGMVIQPGDRLLLSTPVACRDPAAYPDADKIILDRQPIHMTFAYGVHRCLGSHLARRELRVALNVILERLPEFRLASASPPPMYFGPVLGLIELPIVWDV
jgi:cytochrome P450